jgi:uncharacterized protein YjeT (DUF2065 family)
MGMDIVIQTLGIVFALVGIVYLLRPDVMKWLMEFFKQGKRIYFAALIRFALAIVFLVGARECKRFWVIFAFGILFIISGLLVFIIPLEKIKAYIGWWQKKSPLLLRLMALIALAIGAIIIYSA